MTQPTRDTQVDTEIVSAIGERREELGDHSPRFALFLFDCNDPDAIRKTIEPTSAILYRLDGMSSQPRDPPQKTPPRLRAPPA